MKLAAAIAFLAFLLYLSRRKPEIMQFDEPAEVPSDDYVCGLAALARPA